jgi:NADH-quinone oxidoreductase subunit N
MTLTPLDFEVILPAIFLAAWASLLLLADLFVPRGRKGITPLLAALGLVIVLGISVSQFGREAVGFGGMVMLDGFSTFLTSLFALIGLFGVGLAYNYLQRMDIARGEYYVLLLFSVTGMILMSQASDLLVVYLALELFSIPLYAMTAIAQPKVDSEEAGIKYFLLGSFGSAFILYGIAMSFGASGSTSLAQIAASIETGVINLPLLLVGAGLMLVGFGFKVAAVPFHMWLPDVYQGAPTSVTAFMAAGAKAAGFAALLRVFAVGLPALAADLTQILVVLASLSMLVGNFVAIAQTNIKRMLAYSSIAQAGYILMAFVPYANPAVRDISIAAALFYLAAYTLTSFGAWSVVIALEKPDGSGLKIDDYAGLGRRQPLLAAAMTVFMLSLIGLPPTLGLVGKIYLFSAVIAGGYYPLAVVGVLTTLVSAYYYLRVVVKMYMHTGEPEVTRERWLDIVIGVTAVATVLVSFFPGPLFDWASRAVLDLF